MASPYAAVVKRINRSWPQRAIIKATPWMKLKKMNFGEYYILDLSGNVMDTHIDPEELARKLRVLKVKRRP